MRGAGQLGGARVGRERRVEVAHRLEDLPDGVMRLGRLRRDGDGARGAFHRLVEPVEFLQRQRFRGEAAQMGRLEAQQHIERAQRIPIVAARGRDASEIDIGVGQSRIELERAPRHRLGAVEFALVRVAIGEVAVNFRKVGLQLDRGAPTLLRLRRHPKPLEGVGEIVEGLSVVGRQLQRPLEARAALLEFQRLLENDAEIVPRRGHVWLEHDRPPRGLLALRKQPAPAADFGEVAEIVGRRARRLAGLPDMGDREVQIAELDRHETHQITRVRVPRPNRQHLPARHFRLVDAPRPPGRAGALDCRGDVERGGETGI